MVVIGTLSVGAESACRANETVAQVETTKNAKATLTELLDTGKAPKSIRQNAWEAM
jgi:hypothetical protein